MILSAVLSLAAFAVVPQVPSNLRLPEGAVQGSKEPVQRPLAEVERFRRDLTSLHGSVPEIERALQAIGQGYPDVEALVLQRLPAALPRELGELMVAARRFGTTRVADEILFQLLARPAGDSTREMVETLILLKGQDGKKALRACVLGRISGLRRVATEVLARLASADDLEFALELVDHQQLDFQLSGIELLAAIPVPRARERLVQLLAREATVAGAASAALLRVTDAVPFLQKVLVEPAIDRSYAYAAFVLAVGDRDGTMLPPTTAVPALAQFVGGAELLPRALAAVALADLCYFGRAAAIADRDVVAALLDVVAPAAFVPNFELLRRPADLALRQLTGRTGNEAMGWRVWWKDAAANFAGLRARIDLAAGDAAFAVLTLRGEGQPICLLGEQLANLPPVAGMLEYVLATAPMQQLVQRLQTAGFMQPRAVVVPDGLQPARSLELVVRGARTLVLAPEQALPAFDALAALMHQAADAEVWQLLRHPTDEPERGAFWRAEVRFRAGQTDPLELDRRSVQRAIKVWRVAAPQQRALVLAWLLALPRRHELITEADGLALLDIVRHAAEVGEQELVLLELAAVAPGDQVWRECVDLAARAPSGGRSAVDRLFTVLGADRVLLAMTDQRAPVRRAAIDEVVEVRDLRAASQLVAMFDDEDFGVRRAAVYAAGQLALPAARGPLLDRIAARDTDPVLRRDAMAALGRVGGDGAFGVLQRALASPVQADREAALRGLGELKDARAAAQLAQIVCASVGTPTADLARSYLQRMGTALAVPALRLQLTNQNEEVRTAIVLLLGGYLDPQVVPDLTDLLQRRHEPLLVAALLGSTTGLDLDSVAEPVNALRDWYRDHRLEPQWRWLLQALDRDKIATSLDPAQFGIGAGLAPVPELARLMVEAAPGRIRVLASAVLRSVSGEDYGQLTPATPLEVRETIAGRYRVLYESARAAQGR